MYSTKLLKTANFSSSNNLQNLDSSNNHSSGSHESLNNSDTNDYNISNNINNSITILANNSHAFDNYTRNSSGKFCHVMQAILSLKYIPYRKSVA